MTITTKALELFVPTRLVNPTNAREQWQARHRRTSAQREAVAMAVWAALRDPRRRITWHITAAPSRRKHVTLTGHVARRFDSDGLQAAMKSIRDGLQDCGLIHSDAFNSGHVFEYAQQPGKPFGVTIKVELA